MSSEEHYFLPPDWEPTIISDEQFWRDLMNGSTESQADGHPNDFNSNPRIGSGQGMTLPTPRLQGLPDQQYAASIAPPDMNGLQGPNSNLDMNENHRHVNETGLPPWATLSSNNPLVSHVEFNNQQGNSQEYNARGGSTQEHSSGSAGRRIPQRPTNGTLNRGLSGGGNVQVSNTGAGLDLQRGPSRLSNNDSQLNARANQRPNTPANFVANKRFSGYAPDSRRLSYSRAGTVPPHPRLGSNQEIQQGRAEPRTRPLPRVPGNTRGAEQGTLQQGPPGRYGHMTAPLAEHAYPSREQRQDESERRRRRQIQEQRDGYTNTQQEPRTQGGPSRPNRSVQVRPDQGRTVLSRPAETSTPGSRTRGLDQYLALRLRRQTDLVRATKIQAGFPRDPVEQRGLVDELITAMTNHTGTEFEDGRFEPDMFEEVAWELLCNIGGAQMDLDGFLLRFVEVAGRALKRIPYDNFHDRFDAVLTALKSSPLIVKDLLREPYSTKLAWNPQASIKKKVVNKNVNARKTVAMKVGGKVLKEQQEQNLMSSGSSSLAAPPPRRGAKVPEKRKRGSMDYQDESLDHQPRIRQRTSAREPATEAEYLSFDNSSERKGHQYLDRNQEDRIYNWSGNVHQYHATTQLIDQQDDQFGDQNIDQQGDQHSAQQGSQQGNQNGHQRNGTFQGSPYYDENAIDDFED